MADLGTLGGLESFAYRINDSGQVVGVADTSSGVEHAFLYSNGTMNDLGMLPGGSRSIAPTSMPAGRWWGRLHQQRLARRLPLQ